MRIGLGQTTLSIWLFLVAISLTHADEDPRYTVIIPPPGFPKRTTPACVSSCEGMPDGNYPSCEGCLFFTTCSNGYTFPARVCSWFDGLFWNERTKRCGWNPAFCFRWIEDEHVFKPRCVSSCMDMPDGDYHSCHSCKVFLSCVGGYMWDDRMCVPGLVWDDRSKECRWFSRTCKIPARKRITRRLDWDPYILKNMPHLKTQMNPSPVYPFKGQKTLPFKPYIKPRPTPFINYEKVVNVIESQSYPPVIHLGTPKPLVFKKYITPKPSRYANALPLRTLKGPRPGRRLVPRNIHPKTFTPNRNLKPVPRFIRPTHSNSRNKALPKPRTMPFINTKKANSIKSQTYRPALHFGTPKPLVLKKYTTPKPTRYTKALPLRTLKWPTPGRRFVPRNMHPKTFTPKRNLKPVPRFIRPTHSNSRNKALPKARPIHFINSGKVKSVETQSSRPAVRFGTPKPLMFKTYPSPKLSRTGKALPLRTLKRPTIDRRLVLRNMHPKTAIQNKNSKPRRFIRPLYSKSIKRVLPKPRPMPFINTKKANSIKTQTYQPALHLGTPKPLVFKKYITPKPPRYANALPLRTLNRQTRRKIVHENIHSRRFTLNKTLNPSNRFKRPMHSTSIKQVLPNQHKSKAIGAKSKQVSRNYGHIKALLNHGPVG